MSVCNIMLAKDTVQNEEENTDDEANHPTEETSIEELESFAQKAKETMLSPFKFMTKNKNLCIYTVKEESSFDIKVTECAPEIFSSIR